MVFMSGTLRTGTDCLRNVPFRVQSPRSVSDVTRLLDELRGAPSEVVGRRLMPLVYDELRVIARSALRHERADHSLLATDVVHEVYLRLMAGTSPSWSNRAHFFHAAAEAMRRILIEHARKRGRVKRGGNRIKVELSGVDLAADYDVEQVLALDDVFRRLEQQDPRAASVVRMRFYAGLSVEETAKALDVSERTVKREWAFARAWLYSALGYTD